MIPELEEALKLYQEARRLRLLAADRCAFHLEVLLEPVVDYAVSARELYHARAAVAGWNEARQAEEAANAAFRSLALDKMRGAS